jgi:8-amino-7-oxononanoate synthase
MKHESEDALLFNSGYEANVSFFGCVPQSHDYIVYDELVIPHIFHIQIILFK